MTAAFLIGLLVGPFGRHYAQRTALRVREAGDVGLLYGLVTAPPENLCAAERHKVFFRGAYVLETVYFAEPALFAPCAEAFCRSDFAACCDASARRHFAKIMAHLLESYDPGAESLARIADSAAGWAVDPAAKASVRIWSVEVLKCCRDRVAWVAESWDDLLETLCREPSPGIACRMRKSWKYE